MIYSNPIKWLGLVYPTKLYPTSEALVLASGRRSFTPQLGCRNPAIGMGTDEKARRIDGLT